MANSMTLLTEAAPYVAVVVTVIVWSLTQRANRAHELFKERVKRRLAMFEELLPSLVAFSQSLSKQDEAVSAWTILNSFRTRMELYGTDEEIKCYNDLIRSIELREIKSYIAAQNDLSERVIAVVRRQLGIK